MDGKAFVNSKGLSSHGKEVTQTWVAIKETNCSGEVLSSHCGACVTGLCLPQRTLALHSA
jgi:hypothetical protein